MVLKLKEGNAEPVLTATLKRDGSAYDLTNVSNRSVTFVMGATDESPQVKAPATVTDAANGKVQYEWASGDTDTPGTYKCEFDVTGDNTDTTFPSDGYFIVTIQKEVKES